MNRKDLQELARIRLKEATALLKLRLPDGAFYLAGYALECALKACIAKATKRYDFPDRKKVDSISTHNLRELMNFARLSEASKQHARTDPEFDFNLDVILGWSEVGY